MKLPTWITALIDSCDLLLKNSSIKRAKSITTYKPANHSRIKTHIECDSKLEFHRLIFDFYFYLNISFGFWISEVVSISILFFMLLERIFRCVTLIPYWMSGRVIENHSEQTPINSRHSDNKRILLKTSSGLFFPLFCWLIFTISFFFVHTKTTFSIHLRFRKATATFWHLMLSCKYGPKIKFALCKIPCF